MRFIGLFILLALLGCINTLEGRYGSGPIELSPRVINAFEKYKSEKHPGFFAVSNDGAVSGYSFCKSADGCYEPELGINIALFSCEDRSNGVPCMIYANKLRVVWKNYPALSGETNGSIESRLSKLKELENSGLITKEEATEKRRVLLKNF